MKHPINRKVQLYYVCNNIEFKRVLVPLRKLKHLSSWARSVMNLLMRYSGAKTDKKKICACMPVYRVLLGSKFLRVSVHMINCLLTEFGWVGWENIWHSFITHDVIEHEK